MNKFKLKTTQPYKLYFLNELIFQELIQDLSNTSEIFISTIGNIIDYSPDKDEAELIFDNSTILINFSRISNAFSITDNKSLKYYIYGVLRLEKKKPVIYINYYRLIEASNEELATYKQYIEKMYDYNINSIGVNYPKKLF